jgi:hypothetical protein
MHRLNELAQKLSPAQLKAVEDFAAFLLTRPATPGGKRMDVDSLIGLCKGMGGDKSDKALVREAWEEVVKKYD